MGYSRGTSRKSTWVSAKCIAEQTERRRARHQRKIKDWRRKPRPSMRHSGYRCHKRERRADRPQAKTAWSETIKKFRELREEWKIGKLEQDILQEGELELEDTQRWKWTRKQAQYHRKRKEMLAYDSFEDFVSSMSSGQ